MKETDFLWQVNKENRKYKLKKAIAFLQMRLSFGEKRKQKAASYSIYKNDYRLDRFDRGTNSLPEQYYYKPTDIIIYDLIRKEDLSKTKRGLIKLFKKCYSHKFIGGGRTEKDIESLIAELDQTIHSGNSWYKTSMFDFAYDEQLESYIECFEISFHNFSSSYAAIEMRIELADEFKNEISQFIKAQYKKPGMCVHRIWGRNRKKSGANILCAVSSGVTSEYAKRQIVFEQLEYVKMIYLKEIIKYFPLLEYTRFKNAEYIYVFETNITPSLGLDYSVYIGLGLNEMEGFYLSMAERIYTSVGSKTSRKEDNTGMMFVYNPNLVADYEMYGDAHNKILQELTLDYLDELYRVIILRGIGEKYQELIRVFRNKINECKNNRQHHKLLLKLQYQFNQDFYDFKKIDDELPIDITMKRAYESLENNKYAKSSIYHGVHPYRQFTDVPKWIWEQIRTNYSEVVNDLNHKIEISDSLAKYSGERNNKIMVFVQVALAAMTFFLLIFPSKAKDLAIFIKQIWNSLRSLIR